MAGSSARRHSTAQVVWGVTRGLYSARLLDAGEELLAHVQWSDDDEQQEQCSNTVHS
jgi:hypothetical protein